MNSKTYPRTNDRQTVYLNTVIGNPMIEVGDYTIYNDFVNDPTQFEKNNVLYHYPVNGDRLVIGKFCSIACGAKFLFNSANHTLGSLANYTFPLFFEEWGLDRKDVAAAWDNKGDIVIGNDVWIGYEAVVMAGVRIGDGAVIAARGRHQGCPALHHRRRRAGQGDPQAFRRGHRSQVAGTAMVGLAHRENPRKSAPYHAGRDRETHRRIGFARGNGLKHSDLSTAGRQPVHGRKATNPRPKGNLSSAGSVSSQRIFRTLRRRGPVSPLAGITPERHDTPL